MKYLHHPRHLPMQLGLWHQTTQQLGMQRTWLRNAGGQIAYILQVLLLGEHSLSKPSYTSQPRTSIVHGLCLQSPPSLPFGRRGELEYQRMQVGIPSLEGTSA